MIILYMWFDESDHEMIYEMSPRAIAISVKCGTDWMDEDLHNAIIYVGF